MKKALRWYFRCLIAPYIILRGKPKFPRGSKPSVEEYNRWLAWMFWQRQMFHGFIVAWLLTGAFVVAVRWAAVALLTRTP